MLKRTAKPENSQPAAKRKLTRAERKQIEAMYAIMLAFIVRRYVY